ncbi:MAG: toxin-antitoxin system YwqK family antitoxin [Flavobacteriales bacterium]
MNSIHELKGDLNLENDSIGHWLHITEVGDTLAHLNFNNLGKRHGYFMLQDSVLTEYRDLSSGRIRAEDLNTWKVYSLKGYYHEGLLEGECRIFDETAALVSILSYSEGMLEGMARYFHSDGKISRSEIYAEGKMHGESIAYSHESGKKYSVFIYDKGRLIRSERCSYMLSEETKEYILKSTSGYSEPDHIQDGVWKEFHLNGHPKYEHFYRNGLADGEWRGWYENGQLSYIMVYKDNDVFFFEEYDELGNVK